MRQYFRIDAVVLRTRADEFDQDAAERVRDVDDQPIFVAAEIEDDAVVTEEIDGRAELSLDVARTAPARPPGSRAETMLARQNPRPADSAPRTHA